MSNNNHSVDELLAWLDGKSKTYGWGAVVAYDRRRTNRLLDQLYIERFNSKSFLPLINETMESSAYSKEHLTNLKLSAPRLAFSNADLESSRSTLTMDFVGGMIMTELAASGAPARIDRILKILPVGGPQLTMVMDLRQVSGTVGTVGEVGLSIAEGREFKANFVLGDLSQEQVGSRFKVLFEELEDHQKIFPLGELTGDLNGPLTPEAFAIRTMPAPGATRASANNYGDGAVLLFVRLKGGTSGDYPGKGSGFKYLIPADKNGKEYTGSMLLSSRTLFDQLLREHAESAVGQGLKFAPYTGGIDIAWRLAANAGSISCDVDITVPGQNSPDASCNLKSSPGFAFNSSKSPYTVQANAMGLSVTWNVEVGADYKYKADKPGWWDENKEGVMACSLAWSSGFDARLDAQGVVYFEPKTDDLKLSFKIDEYLDGFLTGHNDFDDRSVSMRVQEKVKPLLVSYLKKFSAPNVDTFLIRNLLFPGQNALQLHDVYVPGDLALFGHIDPLRTSAAVSPQQVNLQPGGTQKFTLEPALSGVTWSVRNTDPGEADVGTIDASGSYKAPAANTLKEGYRTVVVTGKGKLDGQDVSASALVSVMASTISVSPIFQVCGAGDNVTLTAAIMGGGNPAWSLKTPALGGKLSTTTGAECVYTAAASSADRAKIYIEAIQVKNAAANETVEALLLVLNTLINLPVVISEASKPETGQVQLQAVGKNGPVNPPPDATCTLLVSGGGTLSPSGVFTEPANANGFAVVSVVIPGNFSDDIGFIVLPLPLSTYADISRRVSDSIQAHSRAFAPDLP
ncbi:hypothetical protein [Pseudomonas sp. Marseille-P9899]|uniref:hypothetical protein n=1 Tax=Pseudomonas sp. Marseille-P9899 TaxID=2730401 RepID=UPI00158D950E|nr:hypothetical protein [Pseudomonas sp. Marseille-P9899]